MWPLGAVVLPPSFDNDLRFGEALEGSAVQEVFSELGVGASPSPFSPGKPGSIKAALAPIVAVRSRAVLATNSDRCLSEHAPARCAA